MVPVPEVKVKPLLAATVVSPFKETAPVPVPKVLAPVWEKELSKVVAPCRVKVPGVVTEPIVFIDEAPVPIVELPEEVSVLKAPVLGVVEPMVPGAAQVPPIKLEALMVPVPV